MKRPLLHAALNRFIVTNDLKCNLNLNVQIWTQYAIMQFAINIMLETWFNLKKLPQKEGFAHIEV